MLSTFMAFAETAGQNGHGSTEQSPRGYRMLPIEYAGGRVTTPEATRCSLGCLPLKPGGA